MIHSEENEQQQAPFLRKSQLSNNLGLFQQKDLDFRNERDLETIISIIEKQPNQKTQKDLKCLQGALKNIKLFSELANEIPQNQMFNLYKELNHQIYPTKKVVFHQGEIGKEFFIILKGSVYIIGNEDKKTNLVRESEEVQPPIDPKKKLLSPHYSLIQTPKTNETSLNKKGTPIQQIEDENKLSVPKQSISAISLNSSKLQRTSTIQFGKGLLRKNTIFIEEQMSDADYIQKTFPQLDILIKLETGSSFGEVALKDSVPRTATAICFGETHFITLNRDSFRKFLEGYYELVQQQNISFVKGIALFKSWPDQMINQMLFFLEKKTVRMNQIIFKEGQEPDGIYLIREGEIKIYQGVPLAHEQEDKLKSIRHFMRNIDIHKPTSFQAPVNSQQFILKYNNAYQVSHLSEGQMFGSDEIVADSLRKHTAICSSSSCSLLFLNKEKFLQYCKRRNTFQNAIEESNFKEELHLKMINQLETFSKIQNENYKKKQREQQNQHSPPRNISTQQNIFSSTRKIISPNIPTFNSSPQIRIKKISESFPEKLLLDLSMKEEQEEQNGSHGHTHKFKLIPQDDIFASSSLRQIQDPFKSMSDPFATSIKGDSFTNLNGVKNNSHSKFFPKKEMSNHNNQQINGNSYYLPKSNSRFIQGEEAQTSIFNTNESSFLLENNQQLLNSYSNQFHFQYNNNNINKDHNNTVTSQQTIRKRSLEDARLAKKMENRLHATVDMHKTFQFINDSNYQKTLDATCVHKLDLENQMIQVCDNTTTLKKRMENLYPQIASYQSKKATSTPQHQYSHSLGKQQIQQRILKTLKLPKMIGGERENLLNIFTHSFDHSSNKSDSIANSAQATQMHSKYFSTTHLNLSQPIISQQFISPKSKINCTQLDPIDPKEAFEVKGAKVENTEKEKPPFNIQAERVEQYKKKNHSKSSSMSQFQKIINCRSQKYIQNTSIDKTDHQLIFPKQFNETFGYGGEKEKVRTTSSNLNLKINSAQTINISSSQKVIPFSNQY